MRRFAFTLSELLITLSIVGLVAVLTIPNVVKNAFTRADVAKLQATYKYVIDALNQMRIDERISDVLDSSLLENPEDFFKKYINYSKDCGNSFEDCFSNTYSSIDNDNFFVATTSDFLLYDETNDAKKYFVKLPSGVALGFHTENSAGGGWFFIDVNGTEQPNIIGRDFFTFTIRTPYDIDTRADNLELEEKLERCLTGLESGECCLSLIKNSGWKMEY